MVHRQSDCNKCCLHALPFWVTTFTFEANYITHYVHCDPFVFRVSRVDSVSCCLYPSPELCSWSLQHVYCLYTTEEAHLVMPSLPVSICAHQRELASKIKTESKTLLYDSILSIVPNRMPHHGKAVCEIANAYVGKDYLLSGNTWVIVQCLKFKLGDLHWSPDIFMLHTAPREHIYCLSSLFRYMCAICFCQIWKELCRPKMTSVWKLCTKTTMLRVRTKNTLPWNNWWWVWVSLHSTFHLCSCFRS